MKPEYLSFSRHSELLILTVSGLSYDLTASTIPTNQLPQPQLCIAQLLIIIIVSYSWHSLLCFPPAHLFQEDLLPSVPLSLTNSLYMFNSQKNTIGCANCHYLSLSKLLWQAISQVLGHWNVHSRTVLRKVRVCKQTTCGLNLACKHDLFDLSFCFVFFFFFLAHIVGILGNFIYKQKLLAFLKNPKIWTILSLYFWMATVGKT